MTADLLLDQVTVRLGGKLVLDSVSATLPGGTLCCLLGPNGAGKTTLLRSLTGYVPGASGIARLGPTDLNTLTSRERAKRIALVPQLAPPVGPLTVFEATALGLLRASRGLGRIAPEDSAFIEETLRQLQLDALAGRRCDELSGGEWRKVLVAQGIVQRAEVMLMDEPTAFLDPPARHAILEAARQLCRDRGATVIAVLHDPQLAEQYADSALLLRDGKVLFHGAPRAATTPGRLDALYSNGPSAAMPGAPR